MTTLKDLDHMDKFTLPGDPHTVYMKSTLGVFTIKGKSTRDKFPMSTVVVPLETGQ